MQPAVERGLSAGSEADRYTAVRELYGAAVFARVQSARLLVIGAGGIGCELLKDLVLTGFSDVHVVDLDSIDVSNLNRQFLFRKADVGQSKAAVARAAALRFNPAASITAHHANVKSAAFSSAFFSSFALVLNALDNVDARRHVNRLCLAASVPLLDSGTQATHGQVVPLLPRVSECYECNAIAAPRTFAVCTIRSLPERDVHCVVWAKFVFDALFGPEDADNVMHDLRAQLSWEEEEEQQEAAAAVGRAERFGRRLADALFRRNIEKQLETAETWTTRRPPAPIDIDAALSSSSSSSSSLPPLAFGSPRSFDQSVLSCGDTLRFLFSSLSRLFASSSASFGSLSFDKDEDAIMDVVSCLANLRMINFHIAPQSRFRLKGVAGNIVHAIATTNAVAAGVMLVQAVKLLTAASLPAAAAVCAQVYISPHRPLLLQPQRLDPPRRSCYVCADSMLTVRCDTARCSLGSFFSSVLMSRLAFVSPSIDVVNRDNAIGTREDCSEAYLSSSLQAVKMDDGALLRVEDEEQGGVSVLLLVQHADAQPDEDSAAAFQLIGQRTETREADGGAASEAADRGNGDKKGRADEEDDDEVEVVEAEPEGGEQRQQGSDDAQRQRGTGSKKRSHSPHSGDSKRLRSESSGSSNRMGGTAEVVEVLD